MLSLITSPIVAKVLAVMSALLMIALLVTGTMYYREKAISAGAQAKIRDALTVAESAQAAAEETQKAASAIAEAAERNRQLAAQAQEQQQAAEARATYFESQYNDARKDPKTQAWANTALPDNVVRLFSYRATNHTDKSSDGSATAPSRHAVPANSVIRAAN